MQHYLLVAQSGDRTGVDFGCGRAYDLLPKVRGRGFSVAGRALDHVKLVGQMLGHYRIVEEIGAGGMGVVYRAHDEHLDREVALKVLPPGTLNDESARKLFRKEARSLSKLNHPNIATVHDFDSQGDVDYLVMEYVPGKTLRDRISEGPLPEAETVRLATQLAKGLMAAHERGLVHRDLKPENVRLTLDGQPKILDFGLAKLIRPFADCTTESNISAVAGTLPYMSPEQMLGSIVDQRADLFSFGVVLYEMATGQRPLAEVEPSQSIAAILHMPPVPPTRLNPKTSPQLERIILKCLEKQPENRYQSAKELAIDLRRTALGISTMQGAWATRLRKGWARQRTAVLLLLGALLVMGGLLFRSRRVHALTPSDTIVLADFVNSTSDSVFDDALNQALTVELEQSPFLKILPQAKIQDTLRLMGRSPDESLTPEVGREVCQRAAAKAVLWGSIATLGTQYVIGLTAAECSTGDHLASEQIQSANKEAVLKALSDATFRLRSKLGESLTSVQKFDAPLEQATTPSLEALKAYSLARKTQYQKGNSAAIPLFQRAIQLDPSFAVAYAALGITYSNRGEAGLANDYLQRAYELRNRVSEREKLRISAYYYSYLAGDLVKGNEIYELWAQAYPRDGVPPGNLGANYSLMGQYEKAVSQTLEHLRIDPDDALGYGNLVVQYTALNRFDEAKAAYQEAMARKLEDSALHANLYGIAFLQEDVAEMERQIAWAAGKPGAEDLLLSLASDTEAFYGRLSKARAFSRRAVDSARRSDQKETAAGWQMDAALREAEFGNASQARKATSSALALASTRDAQILAALALARAGALVKAQEMAEDLAKRFPRDTLIIGYWLPTINAAIEINRRNPSKAIEILQATAPYELGESYPMFQVGGSLYPVYVRAQSYILLHQGGEAATEFQRILDHRGIVMNCPLGALARLGLARAYALQGQTAKSRSTYQDFFTLWKNADSDIPILTQAKAEYAKLQ
ncbi:MAG: protein kinase [Acidobacteriia bacterium]|nr:protein kinase [Terriglobia bacterium]